MSEYSSESASFPERLLNGELNHELAQLDAEIQLAKEMIVNDMMFTNVWMQESCIDEQFARLIPPISRIAVIHAKALLVENKTILRDEEHGELCLENKWYR